MPSQRNQSDSFRFKRKAFSCYQSLKSKVGLTATKADEDHLNVEGCGSPPLSDVYGICTEI